MTYKFALLKPSLESCYEQFVQDCPSGNFYASLKYRNLLVSLFGHGVTDIYYVALDSDGQICAVLPTFQRHVPGVGTVSNSLPFYGSHGGIISKLTAANIVDSMLKFYLNNCLASNCFSSTIVAPLQCNDHSAYYSALRPDYTDMRVGQVTHLPAFSDDIRLSIMNLLPAKTRNMVRKSTREPLTVSSDLWPGIFEFLFQTHRNNLEAVGGKYKSLQFFTLVDQVFTYGADYRIYTAWLDDTPVAALLLFYYKTTIEYFTPVTVSQYRSLQPLTLLIFEAMCDGVEAGFTHWNWGGTWSTQTGVYRFKKSWSAVDNPYTYFINVQPSLYPSLDTLQLMNLFSNFYICPLDL